MLKNYVGVKCIKAEPMSNTQYHKMKLPNSKQEFKEEEGYKVIYPDGYISWSPKDQFERAYMQVGDNNTITRDNVSNFVQSYDVEQWKDKTTVVHATLVNGFVITESSSCVDPANFDMELGGRICKKKIEDKIWHLLGFLLQCGVGGIKPMTHRLVKNGEGIFMDGKLIVGDTAIEVPGHGAKL